MDHLSSDLPKFEREIADVLRDFPRPLPSVETLGAAMRALIGAGLATLPLPGSGRTLERWQRLAAVAACDLSLVKLFESHADALAILAEIDPACALAEPSTLFAVWAAEAPGARVLFKRGAAASETTQASGQLDGKKAWCSGAAVVDAGLLTAWMENDDRQPVLAHVAMRQPGVRVQDGGWNALGMRATASVAIAFHGARAEPVGAPGAYLERPGFWQGAAGIAACWFGAASAVARPLAEAAARRAGKDPHLAAHVGAVDVALRNARAVLHEAAAWIDAHPRDDARALALRARASVEAAAHEVLLRVGRALGPAPLCANAEHAQRCVDLAVFLRQSHAEHDLAALGQAVGESPEISAEWNL